MKYKITSNFLAKESFRSHAHNGIDFSMPIGTPLRAIQDGVVKLADYGDINAGKTILLHTESKTFIYGHLSKFIAKNGQHVKAGDIIGYSGNTGFSTGAHLHFGVKEGGRYIDPSPYVDFIQNMNNPSFIAKLQHTSDTVTLNGLEFAKILSEILSSIKLQFINIFIRDVDYYTFFLQIMKQALQLLTAHSCFLYDTFWRIF